MINQYTCAKEPVLAPEEDRDRKIRYLESNLEGCNEQIYELMQTKTVLIRLLSEEVESNKISKQLVRDVGEDRDNYRRRLYKVKDYISQFKPGQRVTKEMLDKINNF